MTATTSLARPGPLARARRLLGSREEVHLGAPRAAAALAIVFGADLLLRETWPPVAIDGVLDELAHAATTVVVLAAIRIRWDRQVALAALVASVLIDADHIPGALGHWVLGPENARPYSHTLLVPLVFALAAVAASGRRRALAVAVAAGVALHLFRDVCEPGPGSSGAPLLWPFRTDMYTLPYALYAVALTLACGWALSRRWRVKRRGTTRLR